VIGFPRIRNAIGSPVVPGLCTLKALPLTATSVIQEGTPARAGGPWAPRECQRPPPTWGQQAAAGWLACQQRAPQPDRPAWPGELPLHAQKCFWAPFGWIAGPLPNGQTARGWLLVLQLTLVMVIGEENSTAAAQLRCGQPDAERVMAVLLAWSSAARTLRWTPTAPDLLPASELAVVRRPLRWVRGRCWRSAPAALVLAGRFGCLAFLAAAALNLGRVPFTLAAPRPGSIVHPVTSLRRRLVGAGERFLRAQAAAGRCCHPLTGAALRWP